MKSLFVHFLFFILLFSCGSQQIKTRPIWEPELKKIDGVVSAKLKTFLKSTAAPKVVLRVPNIATSITQSDTTANNDYTTFYGQFEMELVKQGFVLRDRSLLQSLMSNGMTNYASIGKKIDTDLILEITQIKFDNEFQKANYYVDQNNIKYYCPFSVENQVFTIDLRVIHVKTGEVGSILKLKTSVFEIFDKEYMTYRGESYLPSDYLQPEFVKYIIHPRSYSYEKTIPLLAEKLSKMLIERLKGDI